MRDTQAQAARKWVLATREQQGPIHRTMAVAVAVDILAEPAMRAVMAQLAAVAPPITPRRVARRLEEAGLLPVTLVMQIIQQMPAVAVAVAESATMARFIILGKNGQNSRHLRCLRRFRVKHRGVIIVCAGCVHALGNLPLTQGGLWRGPDGFDAGRAT